MSIGSLFNQKAFEATLAAQIREGLLAAAEPLIQQALADIERTMRERLAAQVVGLIQSSYDLYHDGRILKIQVALNGGK